MILEVVDKRIVAGQAKIAQVWSVRIFLDSSIVRRRKLPDFSWVKIPAVDVFFAIRRLPFPSARILTEHRWSVLAIIVALPAFNEREQHVLQGGRVRLLVTEDILE